MNLKKNIAYIIEAEIIQDFLAKLLNGKLKTLAGEGFYKEKFLKSKIHKHKFLGWAIWHDLFAWLDIAL